MSLNRTERSDARDELNANLALSGLTHNDVARALQWNPAPPVKQLIPFAALVEEPEMVRFAGPSQTGV